MRNKCKECKHRQVQTYDIPDEGIWFTETCTKKVHFKFLCRKHKEKSGHPKNNLYHKLEKGNGITLFGTSVMLVTFLFFYLLVQVFILGHKSSSIQQAIDNVSDSIAVYMATDGEDYSDASLKTSEVVSTIRNKTNVDLETVTIDESALDDNIVIVSSLYNLKGLSLSRGASTYFTPGLGLREKIVSYAMMWVGVTPYGNYNYGFTGAYSLVGGCDCSGFISLVYQDCGYYLPINFGTYYASVAGLYGGHAFSDASKLQPGDVICYGSPTGELKHVALYAGNGMIVNNGGPNYEDRCQYKSMYYRSDIAYFISFLD